MEFNEDDEILKNNKPELFMLCKEMCWYPDIRNDILRQLKGQLRGD